MRVVPLAPLSPLAPGPSGAPAAPASRSVRLWLGTSTEPAAGAAVRVELEPQGGTPETRALLPDWKEIAPGAGFWSACCALDGLASDRRYAVRLAGGSAGPPAAVFRTLPDQLAGVGAVGESGAGFTVLLGSCFSIETGRASQVGRALASLPPHLFPHVKLLCGDQVYLDLPVREDLPHELYKLRVKILRKYLRNWDADEDAGGNGFGAFLRQGANVFTADDHEFWNNYPARQAHLPITWLADSRGKYERVAREMYRGFQVDYPAGSSAGTVAVQRVAVGTPGTPGGFEVVSIDGRFFRDDKRAHRKQDLDTVVSWLENLKGPAALVLSQPLFEKPAGWFRRSVVDAWIANYSDYKPLAKALDAAPHDVLLLSGDIHRARYAIASPRRVGANTLHEVVSSPLSLIAEGKHGKSPAHTRFPDPGLGGVSTRSVLTMLDGLERDQFATLTFRVLGPSVLVDLAYWAYPGARRSSATIVKEYEITLR